MPARGKTKVRPAVEYLALAAPPPHDASPVFEEHQTWAASIERSVRRKLPPSFDVQDLAQIALIQHWRCVEQYDPARGVPYRAYAYFPIRGAVLMACRRREHRGDAPGVEGPARGWAAAAGSGHA